jgi:hypothetical protein
MIDLKKPRITPTCSKTTMLQVMKLMKMTHFLLPGVAGESMKISLKQRSQVLADAMTMMLM